MQSNHEGRVVQVGNRTSNTTNVAMAATGTSNVGEAVVSVPTDAIMSPTLYLTHSSNTFIKTYTTCRLVSLAAKHTP